MKEQSTPYFAPQLYIKGDVTDISFYEKAFDAVVLRKFLNDDGTIHVAELTINGAMFHIHEEKLSTGRINPQHANGNTALVGFFVADVDSMVASAVEAGATVVTPAQSYDYGYRQAEIKDPFGHILLIEAKFDGSAT